MADNKRSLYDIIEEISMDLIILESGDSNGFNIICDRILEVSARGADDHENELAAHVKRMAAHISENRHIKGSEELYKSVCGLLSEMQAVVPAVKRKKSAAIKEAGEQLTGSIAADRGLVNDFITESREHIENANAALLILEKEQSNKEALNDVFRCFHTLKSLSGFLELGGIFEHVKGVETILHSIRKGETAMEAGHVQALFTAVDNLEDMIDSLSKNEAPGEAVTGGALLIKEQLEIRRENPAVEKEALAAIKPDTQPQAARNLRTREMIKVDPEKLDRLIDVISEMVIAESMLNSEKEYISGAPVDFKHNMSYLNKTTRRLHEFGLSLRLVTLNGLFKKMERMSSDLARKTGKRVEFTMSGESTEIDRSIVEKIGDPLAHMLRNSVDHGIENDPQQREALGKAAAGKITLNAFHKGGNVVIELSDDGQGLDREKILRRGIELGFITPGAVADDADVYGLIFKPGFSTAEKVTDISGRGVGLDVVKKNVELLRGRVAVETIKGAGTKFIITLPLTTAIVEAMVILSGGERYLVPVLSIVESFRPEKKSIVKISGRELSVIFRGGLIPVLDLSGYFGTGQGQKPELTDKTIIVIEDDRKKAGLIVDEIVEQQQIVLKQIGGGICKIPEIAGCTIMSDGKVGLIIDAAEIIKKFTRKHETKIKSGGEMYV